MSPTPESGQTMAEYAVMLTVISAGIMLTLGVLAGNIDTLIGGIAEIVQSIV
jgi:Flp pilus assembly pilin Flp